MTDVLHFLQHRNSAPKLAAPAPSAIQMQAVFQAAMRVPDHAWMRPWRFITIQGDRRIALGEILEEALLLRTPDADEAARSKARNSPLRAPLLIAVVARLKEHPKVPFQEQRFSAACAAHTLLLAVEALGFAGMWRTGAAAFDRNVMHRLGLGGDEEVVGFIYIGTRNGSAKNIPSLNVDDFVSAW
jgi:nitroreductase